jgi:hypothetical protein
VCSRRAQLFYVVLGSQLASFSGNAESVMTLTRALFGDFEMDAIMETGYGNASLFLGYLFVAIFILLSMFLAILGEAQQRVYSEMETAHAKAELPGAAPSAPPDAAALEQEVSVQLLAPPAQEPRSAKPRLQLPPAAPLPPSQSQRGPNSKPSRVGRGSISDREFREGGSTAAAAPRVRLTDRQPVQA